MESCCRTLQHDCAVASKEGCRCVDYIFTLAHLVLMLQGSYLLRPSAVQHCSSLPCLRPWDSLPYQSRELIRDSSHSGSKPASRATCQTSLVLQAAHVRCAHAWKHTTGQLGLHLKACQHRVHLHALTFKTRAVCGKRRTRGRRATRGERVDPNTRRGQGMAVGEPVLGAVADWYAVGVVVASHVHVHLHTI